MEVKPDWDIVEKHSQVIVAQECPLSNNFFFHLLRVHPFIPPPLPPPPPSNVAPKKELISAHFAQHLTFFEEGGRRSLFLLVLMERSQHF